MSNSFNYSDLFKIFNSIELGSKDIIFIHSSIKSLGKYTSNSNLFTDLKNLILGKGNNRTIVVPTFTFDFFNNKIFDIQKTKSKNMGAFSEFIRTQHDAFRTKHPFHSLSSIGHYAKKISNINSFSEFSEGSPFDFLVNKKCKIIFLGVPFVETFFHYVEEKVQVPYREWKVFKGKAIYDQKIENICVNFYARKINQHDSPIININKIYTFLDKKNVFNEIKIGKGFLKICDSEKFVVYLIEQLKIDPEYFLQKK